MGWVGLVAELPVIGVLLESVGNELGALALCANSAKVGFFFLADFDYIVYQLNWRTRAVVKTSCPEIADALSRPPTDVTTVKFKK